MKAFKNEIINPGIPKTGYCVIKTLLYISKTKGIKYQFLTELYRSGCLLLQGL